MWDVLSDRAERTFKGHKGVISSVAFSPDGKKILTGSQDKTAKLWDVLSERAKRTLTGHMESVFSAVFSSDGKKVLTGSEDNTAKLWNTQSGQPELTFTGNIEMKAIAFSPDDKKVFAVRDGSVMIWNVQQDAVEHKVAQYSFYDLVQAGFQLEEEDMEQYRLDSLAFFEKNRQDYRQYHFLMDSLAKVKGLVWNKERSRFIEKPKEPAAETSADEEDFITNLQNQIAAESDTIKLYALYGQLIDSLKNRMQEDPEAYAATLAGTYNNHAWYGFFLKAFKTVEQDIQAGIAVDSTNKYLYTSLAPALLLLGQYEAAEAEYLKWKDQPFGEPDMPTYRDAFLADLDAFVQAGIIPVERKKDVEKIRALLKK